MLDLLAEHDRPVTDLVEHFDISQPSVSDHLRVLREAGLVAARREGRKRVYRLDASPLKELADWVKEFERFWTEKLDGLGRYLRKKHGPPEENA